MLSSAGAEHAACIDEVGEAIRDAFENPAPCVNVTLASELMNEAALLKLDAVIAA